MAMRLGLLIATPLAALLAALLSALLAWPVLLLVLLTDLLCWPFVRLLRRPWGRGARDASRASIITVSWNGKPFLQNLPPSLQAAVQEHGGDHEVIVVDNGSEDGSAEWLAAEHPWVRIVRLPENRHFIRGNAAGAAVATRDILVFLNNDMRVEPDWLVELLRPFGPGDLFATTSRIEMRGARTETGLTRCVVRHGEIRFVHLAGQPGASTPVMWAGGGSSAFDRRKHDAVGGFEALYDPCYVEDVSLSWQAWRRGWRCVYVHDSVVHHAQRGSTGRLFGREALERLDWRNRELFFVRSITDPLLVLTHAALLPWHLQKRARQLELPIASGVRAMFAVLPRLLHAIRERQRSRRHYRRTDRAVLAAVNVAGTTSAPPPGSPRSPSRA